MKTTFKIIGIVLALLLVLAIALPFLFKGKLTEIAKAEINKSVNARIEFNAISLSLFRSFPNFTLGIKGLSVAGINQFEGDTLTYIPSIWITVDLMSVISGSTYKIKKIKIESPSLLVKILKDGSTNYDIAADSGDETDDPEPVEETSEEFMLTLQQVEVTGAHLVYKDEEMNMDFSAAGMDFALSGDLTADQTMLRTVLEIPDFNLNYEGIPYFSKTRLSYVADINADLKNEIYTLKENSLFLNELQLVFDGSVSYVKEDLNIVMAFDAPKSEFKNFLSLIPAIYASDFSAIQSSGKLGLGGHIKGLYTETSLPAFSITLEVENGNFKYPDLPQSVSDVNILAVIENKGGDADNTLIDISKIHMQLGQNPIDAMLNIKTPVSDPEINGNFKGKIDLATVKDFYPMESGEDLRGSIIADITLQGKLSSIENEEYESFTAIGSLLMQNIEYKNSYTGEPVIISNAQLNFSPAYLDLVSFDCTIGENDFRANGKISDYLAYVFKNEVLRGTLSTRSDYLNMNKLMAEEEDAGATSEADTSAMQVFEVPGNIDFEMTSTFGKLIYDTYEMENVSGNIKIKDQRLTLKNLSMNILDGEMAVTGEYSTAVPAQPEFDFNIDIRNIDIQQAYSTFGVMSKFAPIAAKTRGRFSSKFSMRSFLDPQMMPIYETMTGGGKLETTSLSIQGVNSLDKIADALKYEALKNLSIDKILILFKFVDGKILIEPFDFKHNEFKGTMAGWTSFNESIDYIMNLNIPRASFGQAANTALNNLVNQANSKGANFSLGETVSLDVLIGGTLTNPEIKTSLKESGKNLMEDVKKQVQEEIQKQKEELTEQAREQAQKILDEGDNQARNLVAEAEKQAESIRKNGSESAKKVRDEADKQAKKIEDEGKKKGFLAEAAAKESAKQVRKEAEKQAGNLEAEADKQANALVKKANDEAEVIRQNARNEADKVLGIK